MWIARSPAAPGTAVKEIRDEPRLVWIPAPGPGGGGGGGGQLAREPASRLQIPGTDAIAVPTQPRESAVSRPTAPDTRIPEIAIPARHQAAGLETFMGVVASTPAVTASHGPGDLGGGGGGRGQGAGDGTGVGLDDGFDKGVGGQVYQPGNGVTGPQLIRDVKPVYTAEAMRAQVQGAVLLECIVDSEGRIADVKVLRSVDRRFGLDEQAVRAARLWRFKPGQRHGVPVPVQITIELTFALR